MSIRENIGFDLNGFAGDALYGEPPCVDFGVNVLDNDTPSSVNLVQIQHVEPALFERSNLSMCGFSAAMKVPEGGNARMRTVDWGVGFKLVDNHGRG